MTIVKGIFDRLRKHAREGGDRPALIEARQGQDEIKLSYDELIAHVYALARHLKACKIPSGAILSVLTASPMQQAVGIIAGLANGMAVQPLDPSLPEAVLKSHIGHAQPALLITGQGCGFSAPAGEGGKFAEWDALFSNLETGRQAAPGETERILGVEECAGLLIYTSGTTGASKGMLLPWNAIRANVDYAIQALGYQTGWLAGSLLPRFHTFTLVSDIFPALFVGGCVVLTDTFALPCAKSIVETFTRHGVQSYSAAPIILEALCALSAWRDNRHLRFAVAGAAPLKERTRLLYADLFRHPIIPCYGLSETTCFAAISPPAAVRPGAVGQPAGIEIRVVDERGEALAADETGELAMRGASVIRGGYFRDFEGRFAQAFSPDGWFLSGDIGRIDADGYVYVTGRKKNMVIRGGQKIYLEDLDRSLADCPGVSDCASILQYAPDAEDRALTFVVAADGVFLTGECLEAHVSGSLGPRHIPDRIYFVPQIPRTRTGKVSRPLLLEIAQGIETSASGLSS